jgi:uncharacterized protein involved in type VI secretion and phage assembly
MVGPDFDEDAEHRDPIKFMQKLSEDDVAASPVESSKNTTVASPMLVKSCMKEYVDGESSLSLSEKSVQGMSKLQRELDDVNKQCSDLQNEVSKLESKLLNEKIMKESVERLLMSEQDQHAKDTDSASLTEQILSEKEDSDKLQKFYGKYRGTVSNNQDPEQRGRIQAIVPDVSGLVPTSWAEACVPVAGLASIQIGMFALPPIGTKVWIEFEQGNPDFPIWTGCFFESFTDVSSLTLTVPPPIQSITFQTPQQNGIVISDVPGPTEGIMLKSTSGAFIIINDSGIYIKNGKGASIVMTESTVTVNEGALEII